MALHFFLVLTSLLSDWTPLTLWTSIPQAIFYGNKKVNVNRRSHFFWMALFRVLSRRWPFAGFSEHRAGLREWDGKVSGLKGKGMVPGNTFSLSLACWHSSEIWHSLWWHGQSNSRVLRTSLCNHKSSLKEMPFHWKAVIHSNSKSSM